MSWMITDRSSLAGTCYIELLPGQYRGKCWNSESVYFKEEHFAFIEPAVIRHWPAHGHYAFSNVGRSQWLAIIADLERFATMISGSTQLSDLEQDTKFYLTTSSVRHLQSNDESILRLHTTLIELIAWVRNTLETHDTIAVLGM